MQKKLPVKTWIVVIGTILLTAIAGFYGMMQKKNNLKEIDASVVNLMKLEKTVDLSGNIEAIRSKELTITPGQKVEKLYAGEGTMVPEGFLIAELDRRDLELQLQKLRINQEEVQRELGVLEDKSRDTVLPELQNNIDQSQVKLEGSRLKLEIAKSAFEKAKLQYQAAALSFEELSSAEVASKEALFQVEADENYLKNNQNKWLSETKNRKDAISSKTVQLKLLESDIKGLENKISDTFVKANMGGQITDMNLKEKEIVTALTGKILIQDSTILKFISQALQEDVADLNLGQAAKVLLKNSQEEIKGQVTAIKPTALTPASGGSPRIRVEITLDMTGKQRIKPGFEGDATVVIGEKAKVLAVKNEAIKKEKEGSSYLLLIKEGKIKKTPIKKGLENQFYTEILEGVEEKDAYVNLPDDSLKDGIAVKIRQP